MTERSAPLRVLTTGGTLDKVHDWRAENIAFAGEGNSQVPEILEHGRCSFPVVEHVLQLDSLEMTDVHRGIILDRIVGAPEQAIVVTHGTSTMGQTARYLDGMCGDKTVILTGAMRPYSLFVSDASLNLGGALVAAQTLPPGVYGVMNGRVFAASEVRKNEKVGRFDVPPCQPEK